MSDKLNIAVVDDEEGVHKIFQAHFQREVKNELVTVHYFFNGKECINFLEADGKNINILLVLSDINMPVMYGLTLLDIIKREFPKIEVYMITAYDTDDYIKKTDDLGADRFLVKPLDFKKLKKEIKEKFLISD